MRTRMRNERRLITIEEPMSPISEAYRVLRTNIQFSAIDQAMQVITVTSAQPREGKTTTISNLAVAYAQDGKRVMLIDADLRKPTLHRVFARTNRKGLTNVLANISTLEDEMQATDVDQLFLLTSGPMPPNPAEILATKRMGMLLDELRQQFDVILIDTPPALALTDAQVIASRSDGVLLVVSSWKTKRDLIRKCKANLEYVNANLLGVVLNNQNRREAESYYYYYQYK